MLGFCFARLSYLNVAGSASSSFANGAAPGTWYHFHTGIYRIGITLHLGTVLPAGILMVFQFVPVIRHKFITFHRINGYIIILLTTLSNVGALMIARRAFGGSLETQTGIGFLAIIITVSIAIAYYNIKKLQIEQHRAWMLRAMFYMGTIITMRLVMVISAMIITTIGSYNQIQTCGEVMFNANDSAKVLARYPECDGAAADKMIIVHAKFGDQAETIGAALGMSFGVGVWMAIILHLVGVEIYLALTPAEAHRLRKVSYERQLEAGYENPGRAGLTVDRFGDSEKWSPDS